MADIKAAFFDIDGTLLPFEAKHLPASTVDALARLRKNGVKTFIATGRPPVHLPYLHALDGIPFDGYVTMNGQYCYLADGELLYTKYIPAASLQTLLPYIEKEQLSVGFVGKDFCRFNLINDLSRDFAKKLEQGTGDVAALIQHEDIYQLSAFLPPEKEAEFLRRCIDSLTDAQARIIRHHEHLLTGFCAEAGHQHSFCNILQAFLFHFDYLPF